MLRVKFMLIILALFLFFALVAFTSRDQTPEWRRLVGTELAKLPEDERPDLEPFSNIAFLDANHGIAITTGSIHRSEDGGVVWRRVNSSGLTFYSLALKESEFYVVGKDYKGGPIVLRSIDSGENWSRMEFTGLNVAMLTEKPNAFFDICFDSVQRAWISGTGGLIETSIVGQNLEIRSFFPSTEPLLSVACSINKTVWTIGTKSLYRHTNSWDIVSIENKNRAFSRVVSNSAGTWVFGIDRTRVQKVKGIALRSDDSGKTWEDVSSQLDGPVNDAYFHDGSGWLVGWGGAIYKSEDNGKKWTRLPSPSQNDLSKLFFLGPKTGWIAGGGRTVLKLGTMEKL